MGIGPGTESVASFEDIYDAYYDSVARWIHYMSGPTADHEDLIQEVFLIVHRRLSDFDGRNLAGWLYRISANQVRDYQRLTWIKHIFRRKAPVSLDTPSAEPTPVLALEARERQRSLDQLLSRLSSTLRVTFVMFEIEGYTAEEIAGLQSLPTATVRARIHRARKKLIAMVAARATKRSAVRANGSRTVEATIDDMLLAA
jgi:RNA polymerase sigma-70 factor (ECF subfamily)